MHGRLLLLFELNGPNCFHGICDVAQRLFLAGLEQLVLAEVGKTDALKLLIVSLPHSIGAIAQPYAFPLKTLRSKYCYLCFHLNHMGIVIYLFQVHS